MVYVKQLDFKMIYKGNTYHRVADFAKAAGVDTQLVLQRYKRGWRDPDQLAKPPIKKHPWHSPYKINYQGIKYSSLAEFCRQQRLSYTKANRLWVSGIKNPKELIIKAALKKSDIALEMQRKHDYDEKTNILKKYNLYTPKEIAKITDIPLKSVLSSMHDLIRTDSRKNKKGVSVIGLRREDVVDFKKIKDGNDLLEISNVTAIPRVVLKESAIKHIKEMQTRSESLELEPFNFFGEDYYYDKATHTMWKLTKTGYKQINQSNGKFALIHNKKKYYFAESTIEDIYQHPDIKYSQLYSATDLYKILNVSRSYWSSHRLGENLPFQHVRFNYDTKQNKNGWTKAELINGFSKNEETRKFVDLLERKLN